MMRILLVSLCLLVVTSCKKPHLEEEQEGPEATSAEVQDTLVKAWGHVDPLTIQKGEFVYLESTQKLQDQEAQTFLQEGMTVLDRVLSADQSEYAYTIAHQTREVSHQGESKSSTVEEHFTIPNTANLAMKAMKLAVNDELSPRAQGDEKVHPMTLGVQTVYGMLSVCEKSDKRDVSCHNLKYTEEEVPAPPMVREKANCAGIPNCKIHLRHVSFDYIFVETNEETKLTEKTKIQFSMTMSPDVPYLSRLMEYCYRGLYFIPSIGQKVLLQVCNTVKNFDPGTPNP